MNNTRFFYMFGLSVCLAVMLSGCGGGKLKSHGTVKFSDGKPLDRGTITLQNDTSEYVGYIQPNGTFQMTSLKPGDGIPPGKYRVAIKDTLDANDLPMVDAKFAAADTSELTADVTPSTKTIDFVVEPATAEQIKNAEAVKNAPPSKD